MCSPHPGNARRAYLPFKNTKGPLRAVKYLGDRGSARGSPSCQAHPHLCQLRSLLTLLPFNLERFFRSLTVDAPCKQ